MSILVNQDGPIVVISIDRPKQRNAVDRVTAEALAGAFGIFDTDNSLHAAILTGTGAQFCAGADLKAIAQGAGNRTDPEGDGPMGPTRMQLSKPVIAAIEGHAVAGGLELALWCDLRVASRDAVFGVYCRRFGVPLIDGGTVRLPRLIGQSRALDMILTGRPINAEEAFDWGLANRLVEPGRALEGALALARDIAALPQTCMRNDRASTLAQWSLSEQDAIAVEFRNGLASLESGESLAGAAKFAGGAGRGGLPVSAVSFDNPRKDKK